MTKAGTSSDDSQGNYGETWIYESIVGAIPGIGISDTRAVAVQFIIFEFGVIALGVYTVSGMLSSLVLQPWSSRLWEAL